MADEDEPQVAEIFYKTCFAGRLSGFSNCAQLGEEGDAKAERNDFEAMG